ncbi:MAG: DUF350 domain-containing protein [Pseudomonadales bacterium]|nr:DUF350 domain-containing protein [Pseudomonadales bacterium]
MINEISIWAVMIAAINITIAVAAICGFRFLFGKLAGVSTTVELAEKDNYAFGISFAGGAGALALVLSAAVTGDSAASLMAEALNVITYAAAGIVLLKVGALINDRIIFNKFSLKQAIHQQNVGAGVVQAANFLALGFIIHAAMNWVESEDWTGLLPVLLVFIAGQLILILVTRLRTQIFKRRHDGESFQHAIEAGNTALSIRYAGHILGTSLAVSAGGSIVPYLYNEFWLSAVIWAGVAAVLTLLLSLLSIIARAAILAKINVREEVDEQQNIGVAYIEAVIFISVGLLLSGVVA